MNKFSHLVLVSVGLSSGIAFADTLTVDDDGGADFTSITAAVNFASTGDTILVNAGLYEEGPISFLGKELTINGILGGVESVIVRPAVKGEPVFELTDGEPPGSALINLTIQDAVATDSGGGVRVDNGANLVIISCRLVNNSSTGNGGAIAVNGGSNIAMFSCTLSDNEADGRGGGLYVSANSSITIEESNFFLNDGSVGGGLCVDGLGDCTVDRCFFAGNTATRGAGLNIGSSGGSVPGGLEPPLIVSCAFSGNVAGLIGGAADVRLYDDPDDFAVGGSAKFLNCTFSQNSAPKYGVAYASGGPVDTLTLENCVVWKNSGVMPFQDMGVVPEFDWEYCIVDPEYYELLLVPPVESLDLTVIDQRDPRFVNVLGPDKTVGTGDEDLRVMPGSPAIDSGNSALTTTDSDLAGVSRRIDDPNTADGPDAGTPPIDIGAFEFDSSQLTSDGYAIWTGDAPTSNDLNDSANWFDEVITDSSHKWIFDAPNSGAVATTSRPLSQLGALDVGSGSLRLDNTLLVPATLQFEDDEGNAEIRVAPFSGNEATLRFFDIRALCSGFTIGQGGLTDLRENVVVTMTEGGTFRIDGSNSEVVVGGYDNPYRIRQNGTGTAPALINLGEIRIFEGSLEVIGDYAQTGARLDGTEANGLLRMELLDGTSSIDVTGVARLGGAIEFPIGQQLTPIEAGDTFTVVTATDGFDSTSFDLAITTGLGGTEADEALFFALSTVSEFGGSASVVATAVSLDALVSGSPSTTGASGSTLADLLFADINDDGFEDMVLSVDNGPGVQGSVVVLLNGQTPGGVWAGFESYAGAFSIPVGRQPRGLDVGFINNDDLLDIVVANYEDGTASVLINTTNDLACLDPVCLDGGIVSPLDADPDLPNPESSGPLDVYVKDLDGAAGGLSDVLITNERDGSVWAYQNSTTIFSAQASATLDNPKKSKPDKKVDKFPPGRGGGARDEETSGSSSDDDGVSSGSASSALAGSGITMTWVGYDTPPGSAPAELALADFDLDGVKDIATANEGDNSISIFLGTGGGVYGAATTFNLSTPLGVYTEPKSITAGDLDGDGDADVVYIAKDTTGEFVSLVLRNTLLPSGGSLGWVIEAAGTGSLAGEDPYLVRAVDVDNDGDDDVIALVETAPLLFLGGGEETGFGFTSTQMLANTPDDSACSADFDGSGVVDGADLTLLLGEWGVCAPFSLCIADINDDNQVNGADLTLLLGEWGVCGESAPPAED